jgi:membrane-associated phospholipid phosphatase
VRRSEWIGLAYFVFIAAAAWLRGMPLRQRLEATVGSLLMCAGIVLAASAPNPIVRDWAPLVTIATAYYASGLLYHDPSPRFEAWLHEWDRRLLGDPATRFAAWPRLALVYFDLVYTTVFLFVPAGYAALVRAGAGGFADDYWSLVEIAELGSFAGMAFIQSRPPWALEGPSVRSDAAIHRAASAIVQRFTIRANTFPSGHVAGTLAIALAVGAHAPVSGAVFLVLAISTAVACVVGRYHYVMDVVAGSLLAVAGWILLRG